MRSWWQAGRITSSRWIHRIDEWIHHIDEWIHRKEKNDEKRSKENDEEKNEEKNEKIEKKKIMKKRMYPLIEVTWKCTVINATLFLKDSRSKTTVLHPILTTLFVVCYSFFGILLLVFVHPSTIAVFLLSYSVFLILCCFIFFSLFSFLILPSLLFPQYYCLPPETLWQQFGVHAPEHHR